MKRMLFNATQAEEMRVAIVDGQVLVDFDIETVGQEVKKGNIYKGIVTRIEPSLEACFIDYGSERQGFLPFKEVSRSFYQYYDKSTRPKIQDVLKEGMEVLVQVEKDERGNKGAALTTYIGLAGRYLVLMPNNPKAGGISRRIDGEERQELKEILSNLKIPRGMSVIVRTAGIGRCIEDLEWDLNYLVQLWKAISDAYNKSNVKNLLLRESDLVIRSIRDYFHPDIGEILIDNEDVYNKIYQFISLIMPNNLNRVKLYKDNKPLFVRFHIEDQIESAYNRVVELENGGSIVIDHTEALVSIDVNSSRSTKGSDVEETAFKTNLDAVKEITRQIRLRDLGGLIVIDFIDMLSQKNQREIENTLKEYLKKDRARVQMNKISRFGLLELSRQRLQLSLGESSHIMCPRCNGTGFIRSVQSTALQVLRLIQQQSEHATTIEIQALLSVEVATFLLNEKRSELSNLESISGKPIILIPNLKLETPNFEILKITSDNLSQVTIPSYERLQNSQQQDKLNFSRSNNLQSNLKNDVAAVNIINHIQQAPDKFINNQSLLKRFYIYVKVLINNLKFKKEVIIKKKDNNKKYNNSYFNKVSHKNNNKKLSKFDNKKKNFLNDINANKNIDVKKNFDNSSKLKATKSNRFNKNNVIVNQDNIKKNLNGNIVPDNKNQDNKNHLRSSSKNIKYNLNGSNIANEVNVEKIVDDIIDTTNQVFNKNLSSLKSDIKYDNILECKDNFSNDYVLVETIKKDDIINHNHIEEKINKPRRLDNIINFIPADINLNSSIKMEQIITNKEEKEKKSI